MVPRVHERCCCLRCTCDLLSSGPSELSLFAPDVSSALPYQISSDHQPSLILKCCFVISSTPRAPPPRLCISLLIHVREVCTRLICVPRYRLPVQYQVTRSKILDHNSSPHLNHVNSRMLPGVTRMTCVSTETPREASDRSVRATHCEQRLQLREQKHLPRLQEFTRSADAV